MAVVEVGKVTDGFLAFCEAQLVGTVAEGQVGDGKAPDGRGTGYVVVYRVATGYEADGAWNEPGDMKYVKYQVAAVGENRSQAERLVDRVVAPFVELGTSGPANPVTVEDHDVIEQRFSTDLGVGSEGEYTSMQHVLLLVVRRP